MKSDVIIIGSGPAGVNAARPLVAAGLRVTMLDVGHRPDPEVSVPEGGFASLRRGDGEQQRYFLGPKFEGIAFGHTGPGSQLTPPRQYLTRDVDRLTPLRSASFEPLESLAAGGLGVAWGGGSPPFVDADLEDFPYDRAELQPHYEAVARHVGISGEGGDLAPFFGSLDALQPAVRTDTHGESVLGRYRRRASTLNRQGLYVGRPWLAMLSRDIGSRRATSYLDMDFWTDRRGSVYRPWSTLELLEREEGFRYRDRRLALRFDASDAGVTVDTESIDTGERERHRARFLVIAAGALGTTRLVLRSLDLYDHPVPVVCNPHAYVAMLNLPTLGREVRSSRHSLAQGCFAYAPDGPDRAAVVGHLYTYRSLLTFKLIKDAPLSIRDGSAVFRRLAPHLAILIIQHADRPTTRKRCALVRGADGGRDVLEVEYELNARERRAVERTDRAILAGFRQLGCLPLRAVRPGHASSTHYAGSLPMSDDDRPLTTDRWARLRETTNVYIADGAAFPMLPSKGPTFSLMAHAHRVGRRVAEVAGA
ncbi:MAG: GMC oxidoreductase [Acidobacteriota bacterium]